MDNENGLVLVNTGKGKGKTTAALGMVLRSLGYGQKVAVIQFAKGNWHTGERYFADILNGCEELSKQLIWYSGAVKKGVWLKDNLQADNENLAEDVFNIAQKIVDTNNDLKLLVLDEFNVALDGDYLGCDELISFLEKCKNMGITIVVTGRNAPAKLITYADTVTEMVEVKHAYKTGKIAKKGVDF